MWSRWVQKCYIALFFRYEQYENDNLFKPKPYKTLQSVVPNVNLTIFKRRTLWMVHPSVCKGVRVCRPRAEGIPSELAPHCGLHHPITRSTPTYNGFHLTRVYSTPLRSTPSQYGHKDCTEGVINGQKQWRITPKRTFWLAGNLLVHLLVEKERAC